MIIYLLKNDLLL